jgi:hypothetical protein
MEMTYPVKQCAANGRLYSQNTVVKTFSLILWQCSQLLQDKMKQDTDYIEVNTSYDPLLLHRILEQTIQGSIPVRHCVRSESIVSFLQTGKDVKSSMV